MRPDLFLEVLRYRREFLYVDHSSVDNMYKVEFICRLVDFHREEEDGSVEGRMSHNHMYSPEE